MIESFGRRSVGARTQRGPCEYPFFALHIAELRHWLVRCWAGSCFAYSFLFYLPKAIRGNKKISVLNRVTIVSVSCPRKFPTRSAWLPVRNVIHWRRRQKVMHHKQNDDLPGTLHAILATIYAWELKDIFFKYATGSVSPVQWKPCQVLKRKKNCLTSKCPCTRRFSISS